MVASERKGELPLPPARNKISPTVLRRPVSNICQHPLRKNSAIKTGHSSNRLFTYLKFRSAKKTYCQPAPPSPTASEEELGGGRDRDHR